MLVVVVGVGQAFTVNQSEYRGRVSDRQREGSVLGEVGAVGKT